jgi:hypothetical protein
MDECKELIRKTAVSEQTKKWIHTVESMMKLKKEAIEHQPDRFGSKEEAKAHVESLAAQHGFKCSYAWDEEYGFDILIESPSSKIQCVYSVQCGKNYSGEGVKVYYTIPLGAAFSQPYSQLEICHRGESQVFLDYDTVFKTYVLDYNFHNPTFFLYVRTDDALDMKDMAQAARDAAEVMKSIARWTPGRPGEHSYCYDDYNRSLGQAFEKYVEFALNLDD